MCRKALHRTEISSMLLHPQACALLLLSFLQHSLESDVQKVKGSPIHQPQSTLKHLNNLFIQMICSTVSDEVKSPICCVVPFYWCGRRQQQLRFCHALLSTPPKDHHSWAVRATEYPSACCMFDGALPGPLIMQGVKFPLSIWKFCKGKNVLSIFIEGMTARKWVSVRLPSSSFFKIKIVLTSWIS